MARDAIKPVRLRHTDCGLERWNGFTEEWDLLPFRYNLLNARELGEQFPGRRIEWAAAHPRSRA